MIDLNRAALTMNKLRIVAGLVLSCSLALTAVRPVLAARYDIGSAGLPTITGSVGGSVTGSSTLLAALAVTVNFGELSPSNSNTIVKVVVPIAMRTDSAYKVTVTRSGSVGGDANSVQFSDIGFGIQNLRSYGNTPTSCGVNSIIASTFDNDPSSSYTISGATGRAQYPSSFASVGTNTLVINGPQLSNNFGGSGQNDGWAFDAIITVKPQFFTPGTMNVMTLTFTISAGSAFACT
jgi:hypothetical protein